MNRGLLLWPADTAVRIREPQKLRNPIGYGPGSSINKGGGVGGASVTMDPPAANLPVRSSTWASTRAKFAMNWGSVGAWFFK
jgi:hypothetical protein